MPQRLRLAVAAKTLAEAVPLPFKNAATALQAELEAMETQRCALCDGRGHSHVASKAKGRELEACPVRAILRRRLGSGHLAKSALNNSVQKVLALKSGGKKLGYVAPGVIGSRKTGGYSALDHLHGILAEYSRAHPRADNIGGDDIDAKPYLI